MERLLLDFSTIYNKNGTHEISKSVYNSHTTASKEILSGENTETPKISFEDLLTDSIKNVNSLQLNAEKKVRDLAIGDVDDISEVVLASSRADTALRLVMEIRNKFLDAYQALSRITG